MATATKDKPDAADKAKADEERAAKAADKEAERAAKAAEREAAKAQRDAERAAARAAKEQERLEKVAAEGEIDLSSVTGTGPDGKVTVADVRKAIKEKRAAERASRPKKASLTLSQRRALLNLAEGDQVPATAFNCLPLDHLVGVGLAEKFETTRTEEYVETVDEVQGEGDDAKTVKVKKPGTREVAAVGYRLTEAGVERAGEVNPKWKDWKPEARAAGGDAS